MKSTSNEHSIHLFGGETAGFLCEESWNGIVSNEQEHAAKLVRQRDQESFIVARSQLRKQLSERLGVPPLAIEFKQNAFGKSSLVDFPNVHFSVAHTDHAFVIAITNDFPVGVDIEFQHRKFDLRKIASFAFTSEEQTFLNELNLGSNQQVEILKLWTQKEALVKCLGASLESGMQSFSILNEQNESIQDFLQIHQNEHVYTLTSGAWLPTFFISVACESPDLISPLILFQNVSNPLFRCA
ncbi:MAG: hypothetical protein RLZZ531_520 [Bacteroidota bacterium]|jgi:phosphopantetheinyl transferase